MSLWWWCLDIHEFAAEQKSLFTKEAHFSIVGCGRGQRRWFFSTVVVLWLLQVLFCEASVAHTCLYYYNKPIDLKGIRTKRWFLRRDFWTVSVILSHQNKVESCKMVIICFIQRLICTILAACWYVLCCLTSTSFPKIWSVFCYRWVTWYV